MASKRARERLAIQARDGESRSREASKPGNTSVIIFRNRRGKIVNKPTPINGYNVPETVNRIERKIDAVMLYLYLLTNLLPKNPKQKKVKRSSGRKK